MCNLQNRNSIEKNTIEGDEEDPSEATDWREWHRRT